MSGKKNMGQFFTISEELQQFVFDNVKNKSSLLLEPSFGAGHLLKKFKEYNKDYPMLCYELDANIVPILSFNCHQTIIYKDFTSQQLNRKFKTIIGNPPYVKQKGNSNLYIKFIEICYEYLEDNGELIFIVPSDFIKLTSASSIIHKMTENGTFTDFLFPHNEKLFHGATIDVVVFRYEKGLLGQRKTMVNEKECFCNVRRGIITFSDLEIPRNTLDEDFYIYVGLVSGRDEIFNVPFGNIEILKDENKLEKCICIETFPSNDEQINDHLLSHKNELMKRKIKRFTEKNWFEWGALRNIFSIKNHWGKKCIYLKNMTRNKKVAFAGHVQYFGGTLLCLVPKSVEMDQTRIIKLVDYFNSHEFQKDYLYAGRFKIGHKQISCAVIPE